MRQKKLFFILRSSHLEVVVRKLKTAITKKLEVCCFYCNSLKNDLGEFSLYKYPFHFAALIPQILNLFFLFFAFSESTASSTQPGIKQVPD